MELIRVIFSAINAYLRMKFKSGSVNLKISFILTVKCNRDIRIFENNTVMAN